MVTNLSEYAYSVRNVRHQIGGKRIGSIHEVTKRARQKGRTGGYRTVASQMELDKSISGHR